MSTCVKVCSALQDPNASYESDILDGPVHLKRGTGGSFSPAAALRPGELLRRVVSCPLAGTQISCVPCQPSADGIHMFRGPSLASKT